MIECPLRIEKEWVAHTERWILFIDTRTLIEDVRCDVCETLDDCGYHKHLEKIKLRREAEREKEILAKKFNI